MATNVNYIPEDAITSIRQYIIDQIRENYPTGLIPVEEPDSDLIPYVHRIPYFGNEDVSEGMVDYDALGHRAERSISYLEVGIHGRQLILSFTTREIRQASKGTIDAKIQSIIKKYLEEIDEAVWKGNYKGNVLIGAGLISQCTTVEDLDGTDSLLTAGAGLMAGLTKMIETIPTKFRTNMMIVLIMDWHFYDLIGKTIWSAPKTVKEAFEYAHPEIYIVINDNVLASADTAGTHMRLLCFAQHKDVVVRKIAMYPAPAGPALTKLDGTQEQLWGHFFAVKVIEATACLYSEQITYAAS